jgi:hypothetical protein
MGVRNFRISGNRRRRKRYLCVNRAVSRRFFLGLDAVSSVQLKQTRILDETSLLDSGRTTPITKSD